jgi:hypothetical protein
VQQAPRTDNTVSQAGQEMIPFHPLAGPLGPTKNLTVLTHHNSLLSPIFGALHKSVDKSGVIMIYYRREYKLLSDLPDNTCKPTEEGVGYDATFCSRSLRGLRSGSGRAFRTRLRRRKRTTNLLFHGRTDHVSTVGLSHGSHANANAHADGGLRRPDYEMQAAANGRLRADALPSAVWPHAVSASVRTYALSSPV